MKQIEHIQTRVGFIDAMRGFSIFLVVFVHIDTFVYIDYSSIVGSLVVPFFMQLFFFISGFLAYKKDYSWNKQVCYAKILTKLHTLLMPTLVWGLIFTYVVLHENIWYFFRGPYKAGYWFTISLFEIYLVYYIVNLFSYKLRNRINYADRLSLILMIIISGLFLVLKVPFTKVALLNKIGCYSSLHFTFTYFIYFVFGLIFSKYKNRLSNEVTKPSNILIILIIFIGSFYFLKNCHELISCRFIAQAINEISEIVVGISGVIVIYSFFCKYSAAFDKQNIFNRCLKYVGRRTLDVYFIHYFFLFPLPILSSCLSEVSNILLDFFVGVIISVLIIILCLLVGRGIRYSSVLNKFLFGSYINDFK